MHLPRRQFVQLVEQALSKLPAEFARKLNNVAIVVERVPRSNHRRAGQLTRGSTLLGLYEGVPQTERGRYGGVLPDKITLFQRPLEDSVESKGDLVRLIEETVWHEIAHHFGMDERRVRRAEKRRHGR